MALARNGRQKEARTDLHDLNEGIASGCAELERVNFPTRKADLIKWLNEHAGDNNGWSRRPASSQDRAIQPRRASKRREHAVLPFRGIRGTRCRAATAGAIGVPTESHVSVLSVRGIHPEGP